MIYLNDNIDTSNLKLNDVLYHYGMGMNFTIIGVGEDNNFLLFNEVHHKKYNAMLNVSRDSCSLKDHRLTKVEIFDEQEIKDRQRIKELHPEYFI